MSDDLHESSCAVYNAPAYEPWPCDCKYREFNKLKFHLHIEKGEAGLFYGTSKDEPGLLVTGQSEDEVVLKVPEVVNQIRILRSSTDNAA